MLEKLGRQIEEAIGDTTLGPEMDARRDWYVSIWESKCLHSWFSWAERAVLVLELGSSSVASELKMLEKLGRQIEEAIGDTTLGPETSQMGSAAWTRGGIGTCRSGRVNVYILGSAGLRGLC
jgi:hypothetical protein